MKFVILAKDKWENLSPKEKADYLKAHPNSKYGKKKKKKVGAGAAKPKSKPKSKPAPESNSEPEPKSKKEPSSNPEPKPVAVNYENSEPPILLLDDESAKLAEQAIEQELATPEVQKALNFLTTVKKAYMGKLEEDREDTLNKAKLVSAGITMLISLALVAALPDLAPSIHSLGTLAGATIWDVIGTYDEDDKEKAEQEPEPEIEFDSRVDEQFNNEQRRNMYATLNMNAAGEFKDEQFRDAVAEKFIKRNGVVT